MELKIVLGLPGRCYLGAMLGWFGQDMPFDEVKMEGGRVGVVSVVLD